ncbi:MAG: type III pantothenate kinase [Ignavibacteria bacterium]|jgi:type III pantothenate kinase|nr:type III pantothenate kinase [Ignavibacteria bacterium]
MNNLNNTAFIDIGNTNTKILLDGQFHSISNTKIQNICNELAFNKAVVSSVQTSIYSTLATTLNKAHIAIVNAAALLARQNIIDLSEVDGIGTDRVLGLIGAMQLSAPPLITVDCGTATTINLLDANNIAKGGTIMPGITTMAKALNEHTSLLPLVNIADNYKWHIGENTDNEISAGIVAATAGAINFFLQHTNRCNLVLTGGYGNLLATYNYPDAENVKYAKHLVLNGLQHLYNTTS